jgi:3-hydroxybutyrate dehydrogenase
VNISANKVALITGSTSGIGLGIAEALAREKYDIQLHGLIGQADGENILASFRDRFGVRTEIQSDNLAELGSGERLFKATMQNFGRIDLLVNNAGIQYVAPIENFPLEEWQKILQVNLNSAFETIRASLGQMRKQGGGRIVNIASVHGLVASSGKSAYVAAKHALIGLTKVVALETAQDSITCNAICPGWVKTPLVEAQIQAKANLKSVDFAVAQDELLREKQPNREFVTVEEIGAMVSFLASNAARSITGSSFTLDGGWTAQ